MYSLKILPYANKKFSKMEKRDKSTLEIIDKKVTEIRNNPQHEYKFLKSPLHGFNRVHINGHFVLVFKIHHDTQVVELWDYDHHDNIYKSRILLEQVRLD